MPIMFQEGQMASPRMVGTQFTASLQVPEDDRTVLWRNVWNYQRRGNRANSDPNLWESLWPRGGFTGCAYDPVATPSVIGNCPDLGGYVFGFESDQTGWPGSQNTKFIKGICRDASDVAVSGAVVQGFLTADDLAVGYEVQSRGDGSYDLPTIFKSTDAHYVVAYKAGSPDTAGTTVNTLTPTNIDGS